MEELMPEKFPEVLPPKGEGRVDSKHRIALLTEPEIGALNFLKNMDKAMGYKSGFSPMMQNLASQDTQPLEYVEYRGERIPSLNDFSGGAGKNEKAGEQEARQQTQSGGDYGGSNDWAAQERRRKEAEEKAKRDREWAAEQERKAEEERKKLEDIERYIAEQRLRSGEFYGYGEGGTVDDLTRPERDPGSYGDPRYRDEGGYDYPPGTTPPTTPDSDGGGDSNPYDIYPEFQAWDGTMHWTQEDADAMNAILLDQSYTAKESELKDYGSTTSAGVYDEIASDYQTHLDSLTGKRESAYNQALAGLYDDQQLTGLWDQEAYDKALAGLDEAVLGETGELDQYGASLKSGAEDAYNTWLTEQMDELGKQDYQGLQDWDWSDLDLSDFTDDQEYKDFDFLSEFKKLTPEGEAVKAEGDAETEGGEVEGDAAPASRTASRKKKRYAPISSSASLTGGGSSTNIG